MTRLSLLQYLAIAVVSSTVVLAGTVMVDDATPSSTIPPLLEKTDASQRDVGRCYKGYCWQWCLNDPNLKFWCYTTLGSSMDRNYVKCTYPYECQNAQKCAGPCGL